MQQQIKQTGISISIHRTLKAIFDTFPEIERVLLFGSRAKGNFTASSDADLALCGTTISAKTVSRLLIELDELPVAYRFDVVRYHTIKEEGLTDHINRAGVEIYRRT